MKKLKKIEKSFASLENKELKNLEKVTGGAWTVKSTQSTNPGGGGSDTRITYDNGKIAVITFGPLE